MAVFLLAGTIFLLRAAGLILKRDHPDESLAPSEKTRGLATSKKLPLPEAHEKEEINGHWLGLPWPLKQGGQ